MTYDQLRQIRTERRMPVHDFDEGRRMAATAPTRGTKMKAIVRHKYGTSDDLGLEDVDVPGLEDDRARAGSRGFRQCAGLAPVEGPAVPRPLVRRAAQTQEELHGRRRGRTRGGRWQERDSIPAW